MMQRRITLTIAAAILTLVAIGVLVFAATTNEPQAAAAPTERAAESTLSLSAN